MQSRACYLARSVMSDLRRMIVLAVACSKRRSTRARQNFAAGRSQRFCSQEITRRSKSGEKNGRSNEQARTGQICWVGRLTSIAVGGSGEPPLPDTSENYARVNSAESK